MPKKSLVIAAVALFASAAVFIFRSNPAGHNQPGRPGFVQAAAGRFVIDGQPFRFVGANVAVMFRDEDRAQMPETMRQAAQAGIKVVRVWAFGEGGPDDVKPIGDFNDWPRTFFFRKAPGQWNEGAFIELDRTLAEAARNHLRVQLCLANWWRDTGGVTQYLRWAGINDAADDARPFGINNERAMLFYTNELTRQLYREHLEKIATRRNSVTGILYRDDPAIFGYELMNEAQSVTLRWPERRAWFAEMSSYLKSLDPHHLITPGDWGYRSAAERREWLADHALPNIDYCDVHHYPREDHDIFVESPEALREFVDNRVAAAYSLRKPLTFGEFGMGVEGYKGLTQTEWYRAFFETNARRGVGGAMFWILTPDPRRGYGVTSTTPRDQQVFAEISRAATLFASLANELPPKPLRDAGKHLVPLQFAFTHAPDDPGVQPQVITREDRTLLYRFKPESALAQRFEKIGGGPGYIWGSGVGNIEYLVPGRRDHRRVGGLVVRAHIQPVLPIDARPADIKTRVTLFVNGTNCGSRLIPVEPAKQPLIQEWTIDSWSIRLRAARGLPITIGFAVTADSDWLYGVNISNWPEGYDSHDATPVEVELR
ncbi:MAG: Cellulase (Glycosyl hydrolase family 5) [Acidobacteria bacterium]|nr:Cellulase (Glycosyl hydrolase family 5) [Acidobacteriota bacterium]